MDMDVSRYCGESEERHPRGRGRETAQQAQGRRCAVAGRMSGLGVERRWLGDKRLQDGLLLLDHSEHSGARGGQSRATELNGSGRGI